MTNTEAEIAKLENQKKRDIERKIKQIKLGTANYGIVELGYYEYPKSHSHTGNWCDWYIGIETERKHGNGYRNTITKTVIVHSRDEALEKLDILIHDLQELRKICREKE